MCVTSVVINDWMTPGLPNYMPWTPVSPSPNLAQEMLTVIQKLEAIDKRLNALDCKLEDAVKRKFKAKLQKRANSKPKKR